MLIFGTDTCCMAATAALLSEERLVAQTVLNNKKTHSQNIMPMIEFMMEKAEAAPGDIDCYAAAVGPGSFTGVRIGVATVKALAYAAGKPCVAVSTLEALAHNVICFDGIICPILDARRNQVYNALFNGLNLNRITDDRALGIDELLDELSQKNQKIIFVGDGVAVFKEKIKEKLSTAAVFAPVSMQMNLAASVAEIGLDKFLRGEVIEYDKLVPQYLRLSQAERERLEREGAKQ